MSNPKPTDARGRDINIGDFVCYTTNTRESGLAFGFVRMIKERAGVINQYDPSSRTWNLVPHTHFRIAVNQTDAFGNPKYVTKYDPIQRDYVKTPHEKKSGLVNHSSDKFLRL